MSPPRRNRQIPSEKLIDLAGFRSELRAFLHTLDGAAERAGLTQQQNLLLLMIEGAADGSGRSTPSELAERLALGRNTVTEPVDRAAAAGLVAREPSPQDGRVVRLRVTREGTRRLEWAVRESESDRDELERMLRRLGAAFRRAGARSSS